MPYFPKLGVLHHKNYAEREEDPDLNSAMGTEEVNSFS